jgi:hypothetical protein
LFEDALAGVSEGKLPTPVGFGSMRGLILHPEKSLNDFHLNKHIYGLIKIDFATDGKK